MIANQCFTKEWIARKRVDMGSVDPVLLEKSIHFKIFLFSGEE